MNILNGIQHFLELINNHWTTLIVIAGLILTIAGKAANYFRRSKEEKIKIIKIQIREIILKLVSDAEEDYAEWKQAGSVKRALVIGEIFSRYPVLSRFADQQALIGWIDQIIDESLITLEKIITDNTSAQEV